MDDTRDDGAAQRKRAEHLKHATDLARRLEEVLEQADALKWTGFNTVLPRIEFAADDAARGLGKPHQGRETYSHDRPSDVDRPVIRLFVDESGPADDVREWESEKKNDFFTLGGIAISDDAHKQYREHANQLKREFFRNGPGVILHAFDLRKAMEGSNQCEGNLALNTDKSWPEFVEALEELVEQTHFTAFGIIIQKWVFHQEFTTTGEDPFLPRETYDLALHLLLERFVSFLASATDAPIGSIALEYQSPEQNARHQLSIAETIAYGTRWISPEPLQHDILPGVEFLKKQPSHPLELSDMLANLLYRLAQGGFYNNRLPYLRRGDKLWDIFYEKLYGEGNLRQGKFGLKVFPTGDLDGWLNDLRDEWLRRARSRQPQ